MGESTASIENIWIRLAIFLGVILAAYLVDLLFEKLIIPAIKRMTEKTEAKWDDILLSEKVCNAGSNILPPIIMLTAIPMVSTGWLEAFLMKVLAIYITFSVTRFVHVFISAGYEVFEYRQMEKTGQRKAVKGVAQVIQVFIWIIAIIIMVSILINRSPLYLLGGLGAAAAVLMLAFQDTIKGLVAGVQLSANDMLRPGEWISVPSKGIDGIVKDVTLTTVKIQNWDNTIMTIQPYTLFSETFQNWRGMTEAAGRRINKTLNIDIRSVHIPTQEELDDFKRQGFVDATAKVGEQTNLEIFRQYFGEWLRRNPMVNPDMGPVMCRQVEAGPEGLTLQIYCFSRTKVWAEYENVGASLLEHMIAILPEFGLVPYQRSTNWVYPAKK
mgnify:CR=1 FL=1